MRTFLSRLLSPTALLYIFVIVSQIAQGIYSASKIEPPPGFSVIYGAGLLWIIGWWLLKDSRNRGVAWTYDIGFFLTVAWPFVLPYYLFKTRGAQGLLVILAFVAVYIGALGVGIALYLFLAPPTG